MRTPATYALLSFALTLIDPTRTMALELESGPTAVPVVELFTSQGCSSCPPADAWLSTLANREDLWQAYVPLAWHVDYWNRLGWKDPFSRPDYSARQGAYRDAGAVQVVYTPGMFVSGREWSRWHLPLASVPGSSERVGTLALHLDGGQAQVTFEPAGGFPTDELRAHLALLGMGLETRVSRGENRGRTLREDFVVLGTADSGVASRPRTRWRLVLPEVDGHGAKRRAVAAWISRGDDPGPLQAVGGWWE